MSNGEPLSDFVRALNAMEPTPALVALASSRAEVAGLHAEIARLRADNDRLRAALSEGLDLCVRARRLDERERELVEWQMRNPDMPRSVTVPMWAEEQYQADLNEWEKHARAALAPRRTGRGRDE